MDQVEVILVTGLSGAGKSSAMTCFENMGYRCMDNYPVELLKEFGELLKTSSAYPKIALAVPLAEALKAIQIFRNMDWLGVHAIFLDCNSDTLVHRYKQTRRAHPLIINGKADSLEEAINEEIKIAKPVSRECNQVIDTTKLTAKTFQKKLENLFLKDNENPFRITFTSFGFKHGLPKDCDLVLDVRFLPNPFYVEELRPLTGNDKAVYDYVMDKPETKEFTDKLLPFLDYLIPQFEKEGKKHLVVGIGCTGGQHRSVTITNFLADYFSEKAYHVHRLHRDAVH